jgi:MFS family permease
MAVAETPELPPEAMSSPLPAATRLRILVYFGGGLVLMGFPGPLIGIPLSFFLKNKLHLAAHELAIFGTIAAIPTYFAVVFGFVRDRWSPLGRGDRGFLMLFGVLGGLMSAGFAFAQPVYSTLLLASLTLTGCFLFIRSALRGLIGAIGQQHAMSGQVAAAVSAFEAIPGVVGLLAGGLLSSLVEGDQADQGARLLFLVCSALLLLVAIYGLIKPRAVFDNVSRDPEGARDVWADLKRLVRYGPIYPALAIWLLWQFVPGFGTPLQYFMQDTLKFSDAQYSLWFALYVIGSLPGFALYAYLCRRFTLRTLLIGGVLVALPMMLPLLLIHDKLGALSLAAPMGALGGVGGAACFDLIIRSCPPGLQGSMLMAAVGVLAVDGQMGDLLGTTLYDHFHDFTVCVIAMTVTNALILPAILLVPSDLIATADGGVRPDSAPRPAAATA